MKANNEVVGYKDIQAIQTLPAKERKAKIQKLADKRLKQLESFVEKSDSKVSIKSAIVDSVWTREEKGHYTDGFNLKVVYTFEHKGNESGKGQYTKDYPVYAYPPKSE